MGALIVAFAGEETRGHIRGLLEKSGLEVSCACASGAEAIRYIRKLGGGLVVSGFRLSEMTAPQLAADLGQLAMVLVVATAERLEDCYGDNLYRLAAPVTRADLAASVNMLMQMEEKLVASRHGRRSEEERRLLTRAKELLMAKSGMTEAEAHRFIQKKSMDTGARVSDTARLIIEAYD